MKKTTLVSLAIIAASTSISVATAKEIKDTPLAPSAIESADTIQFDFYGAQEPLFLAENDDNDCPDNKCQGQGKRPWLWKEEPVENKDIEMSAKLDDLLS